MALAGTLLWLIPLWVLGPDPRLGPEPTRSEATRQRPGHPAGTRRPGRAQLGGLRGAAPRPGGRGPRARGRAAREPPIDLARRSPVASMKEGPGRETNPRAGGRAR